MTDVSNNALTKQEKVKMYNKVYYEMNKEQISQIDSELTVSKKSLSNLEKAIDKCMNMSLKLPSMWRNSNYVQKRNNIGYRYTTSYLTLNLAIRY